MRAIYLRSMLLCLCLCHATAALAVTSTVTVTIPNQSHQDPPCIVKLPASEEQCRDETCRLPLPKGSTAETFELHLTCLPPGSLTGIERPPPGAWEESVRAGDNNVNILLMDAYPDTPEAGMRSIDFCVIGHKSYFCGATTLPRMNKSSRRKATAAVKAFIKGIDWPDGLQSLRGRPR